MDKLLFATRMVSMGSETKQNDTELITDIERLINIVNQCVSVMEDFIVEVHVSPMNMLQAKFKDIKKLKFSIIYNGRYTGLEYLEKKQECTDLLRAAVESEFEGIDSIGKVDYSLQNDWDYPTFLIYTVFPRFELPTLVGNDYKLIRAICEDGFAVSVPNSYNFQKVKCMYIHCSDLVQYPILLGSMSNSERQYGKSVEEFKMDKDSYIHACYIPIVGLTPLQYTIPYAYITIEDFVQQESSEELKE